MQVPEFLDLPAATRESLAHVLTEKVFAPKSVIYFQGQEVEDVFIVQRGSVKVLTDLLCQGLDFCTASKAQTWESECTA